MPEAGVFVFHTVDFPVRHRAFSRFHLAKVFRTLMNVNHLSFDGLRRIQRGFGGHCACQAKRVCYTALLVSVSGLKPVGSKALRDQDCSIIRELELDIPVSFRENYGSRPHRAFVVDKYIVAHMG